MSDNIFADIYNKILSLFGQNVKDESKNTAVNRLRLVLMQDRTNLTPEIMHRMRTELIEVLSKYVELDKEALDLNFEQEGEQMALMLSIPVIRAKDEAEIEEALKKEDEARNAKEKNESESESGSEENTIEENNEENSDDTEIEIEEENSKTTEVAEESEVESENIEETEIIQEKSSEDVKSTSKGTKNKEDKADSSEE